jgi:outer membrane protein OmpA-like peptidoglycan-associated protein
MKAGVAAFACAIACVFALGVCGHHAHAEEGGFNIQLFQPSAAPRDLLVVQKSEIIGHLSPTLGLYADIGLGPLVLVNPATGETTKAVGARLQLNVLAGIGFYDLFDVKLSMPYVPWQISDNLRRLGLEGTVKTNALADMSLTTRMALPWINRKNSPAQGLGLAVAANLNLPTGDPLAFTGDGTFTGGATVIGDYRLGPGAIVTGNLGVWFRPDRQIGGARVDDMALFGVAAEAYVIQRMGISVIGEIYGYPLLHDFVANLKDLPSELIIAGRWQSKYGVTLTFGTTFGINCDFVPAFRAVTGITWQPMVSREQMHINSILERNSVDPDDDGLIGHVDHCPEDPGPWANRGCPDKDKDGDGLVDREDECPDIDGGKHGKQGCPRAYIEGDKIVIVDKVHFATDSDIILDESKPILEAVGQVLLDHPEILEVHIEGHTDVRAGDAYNLALSQRRVESVRNFLIGNGIAEQRLVAKGLGHSQPLYDDSACDRADEELDRNCLFMTSQNRRVVFHIVRWAPDAKK